MIYKAGMIIVENTLSYKCDYIFWNSKKKATFEKI